MVRHDGTVARLTCHNIGIILQRYRKKQALSISKVFKHTDAPILQTTALTVFAYHDAVERHERHIAAGVPFWTADPYAGETQEDRKKNSESDENGGEKKGPNGGGGGDAGGGGGRGDPRGGPRGGRRGGGRGGGNQGGSGGRNSGGGNQSNRKGGGGGAGGSGKSDRVVHGARKKPRNHDTLSIDLAALHLAFRAPESHLWSTGFSHFKRIDHHTPAEPSPASLQTPRGQEDLAAYFRGSLDLGAVLAQNSSGQQRRVVSAESTQSSLSDNSARTSVPSPFSGQASSAPTSPSTTASFTDVSSREGSPLQDKGAGRPTGPEPAPAVTIDKAGALIDGVLDKRRAGPGVIVWSGRLLLEDGGEDDDSIPVAVKMAVPQDNIDRDATHDAGEKLRREGSVYEFLVKSGKQEISPRYFGTFRDNAGSVVLIIENGGTALESFDGLPTQHRKALLEKAEQMHIFGIVHNDLEPRNIVRSAEGELRIIDFGHANMGHSCDGREECEELLGFKKALEL
ncbi:hypothetical protein B0H15DRAFT_273297 [Mycena belliarum]|uniref:Protein kinase domain-containing protein n=1 Tax=Mycena belliarum TaxID=1033014 RepID=A0AAD6XSI5_9AGAR|nr:hypothetical protein B0H15DRAFT_273297 [Mycena belliae]